MLPVLICALASLQQAVALAVVACAMPGPVARGFAPVPSPAQLLAKHARLAPLAAAAASGSSLLRRTDEFQSQSAVYGSAIAACADSGEWRGACALLSELDSLGLSIAGRPLTGALRATARAAEWDATKRLRSMAMARNVPITRAGCAPPFTPLITALSWHTRLTSHISPHITSLCWRRVGVCAPAQTCRASLPTPPLAPAHMFRYSHTIGVAVATGHNETAAQMYAVALQQGKFRHWRQDEPMTIDLHGFTQAVAVIAVRHALK
jgi:hypothetical protein